VICKQFACVLIFVFASADLFAQTGRPTGLPGEMLSPVLETETSKTDLLVTGFRISSDFDDNALDDNRNKQSNIMAVIEPHLGWKLSHSRWEWDLDYHPGFSISQLQAYNSRSQILDSGLQLRLTKRLQVRLRNSFLKSTNPFDRLRQPEFTPDFGILDRPNDSILLPAVRRTSEQAGLDLTYALAPHTIVGASGSFFTVKYNAPTGMQPQAQPLENANSTSGHAFYSQHLTRRTWVGLDYNVQKLGFRSGQSRALIHSVFYDHTIALTPNMALSVFGGPEHSATSDQFPAVVSLPGEKHISNWHWAGGATYNWSGAHTTLAASLFRKISDGGGLLGAVQLSGVTLELRRQLTHRWTADLLASYENNKALDGSLHKLAYASATSGLTRTLNQNLSLEFRYWRVHQSGNDAFARAYLADHNRVSASLAYDFKLPLEK
jgi:hypothetical protein